MKEARKFVPRQRIGGRSGATQRKETATRHDAILLFNDAKRRLLDVNSWNKLCGKLSANFQLTDEKGNELRSDKVMVGNLIRISLPAPRNESGAGSQHLPRSEEEHERSKQRQNRSGRARARENLVSLVLVEKFL